MNDFRLKIGDDVSVKENVKHKENGKKRGNLRDGDSEESVVDGITNKEDL
ncbi:hypothetical protein BpHYR1_047829, partial [Brachionus plicatilis]